MKKRSLGKGLEALIPKETIPSSRPAGRDYTLLDINLIRPNKLQPRKNFNEDSLNELAGSIRENGIIQPLVVRRKGSDYEIIAGERRW
ncbi:MAG: ParB N-terminal domain-containing protein, partial [Thermodesulfobacteriota bacterium]